MLAKRTFLAALVVAGAVSSYTHQVRAAEMVGGASYVVETTAKPGCRAVVLHIIREGGALTGVVFFKDGSGVSSVKGTTDGHTLQWTMAPLNGSGPTGQVTGQVSSVGNLTARLTGTDCTLETTVPQYHENAGGSS